MATTTTKSNGIYSSHPAATRRKVLLQILKDNTQVGAVGSSKMWFHLRELGYVMSQWDDSQVEKKNKQAISRDLSALCKTPEVEQGHARGAYRFVSFEERQERAEAKAQRALDSDATEQLVKYLRMNDIKCEDRYGELLVKDTNKLHTLLATIIMGE